MSLRLRSHQQSPAELSRRLSGPRENILHGVADLQRTIDRSRLPPEHVPTEPCGGGAGGVSELLFPSLYQRRDRCDRPSWTKASAALLNILIRHRRSVSRGELLLLPEAFGLLGPLAGLDDVTVGEQGGLECNPPLLGSPGQELEIHREVLEILLLGVRHDRLRVFVGLN